MIKQLILIRKDLKMRRGKEIAQGSHASMAFLTKRILESINQAEAQITLSEVERLWLQRGMTKICLQVSSEDQLLELHQAARQQGLVSHLIHDSGKTEFAGQVTLTACAIGPAESAELDEITGALSLY